MSTTSGRHGARLTSAGAAVVTLSLLAGACTAEMADGGLRGASGAQPGVGGSGSGAATGAGAGVATGGSAAGVGAGAGAGVGAGGTSSGGSGATAGSTGGPQASPMDLSGAPIYTRVMRLTNEQWENSVTDILRLSARPGLAQSFEQPVAGTTDFTNNEHLLTVSNALWSSYQLASETVAAQATGTAQALSNLHSGTDAAAFIREFGRRAFRRPLTTAEEQTYQAVFDIGAATSGTASAFAKGAAVVIRGMLQSPHFLYRTEMAAVGAPLRPIRCSESRMHSE
jgi:hypothetical protein